MKKKTLIQYLEYFDDDDNIIISDDTTYYDIDHIEGKSYQVVLYIKGDKSEDKKGVRE